MKSSWLVSLCSLSGLLWIACGSAATPAPTTTAGAEQTAQSAEPATEPAAPAEPVVLDPAKVSPDVFKVVLDGPRMRVIEANWQPGQHDNKHGHPSLVAYAMTEIFGIANDADDTQISIRIRKDQALLQAPVAAHSFENRGRTPAKMLIIERKEGQPPAPAPKDAKEAQVVSRDVYELVAFDTTIHVLRATWQPGQSDEYHGHAALVAYALTDIEGKMYDADGKATPFSMKAGTARFEEPVKAHYFENTGSAVAQMLLIEPKQ